MTRSLAFLIASLLLTTTALAQVVPPPPPVPPPGVRPLPLPPGLPPLPPIHLQPPAWEKFGEPQLIDTVADLFQRVRISPKQEAEIVATAERMQKEYIEAKDFAPLSKEQQAARREALAYGKASGLVSQALTDYADEAANVTPRQRGGMAWARGVQDEFRERVSSFLTTEQKALLASP